LHNFQEACASFPRHNSPTWALTKTLPSLPFYFSLPSEIVPAV